MKNLEFLPKVWFYEVESNELQAADYYTHGDGYETVNLEWSDPDHLPETKRMLREIYGPQIEGYETILVARS